MKVLGYRDLRCPVTGKAAYISEERALGVGKMIAGSKKHDPNRHNGKAKSAYKCPDCHWWHMTRWTEKEKEEHRG